MLGVAVGRYLERASPAALAAFGAQRALLATSGFTCREVQVMDDFERIVEQLFVVNRYELAQAYATWFPGTASCTGNRP